MGATTYFSIGVMSGTSLDGLDLAYCTFQDEQGGWKYEILAAETIPYSNDWLANLMGAPRLSGQDLVHMHFSYGRFLGEQIRRFINRHKIKDPGIVACHGHTIFHNPGLSYTFQLGHGAAIAAETGLDVVTDFRSSDVALGGQGAPLVPIGDALLFGNYTGCMNLGGFANVSYRESGSILAFDICPLNFVINRLVQKARINEPKGNHNILMYDHGGRIAREGQINNRLLKNLNNLPYYAQKGAKSLGEEWVSRHIWPLLAEQTITLSDLLRTFYEHAATQIAVSLTAIPGGDILISGGGAYNTFMLELIKEKIPAKLSLIIPNDKIIEFKESLIFAFLGMLRVREQINCLSSVTGSTTDSCSGSIYLGSRPLH